MFRVGIGQDSHKLNSKFKIQNSKLQCKIKNDKNLVLGGVEVSRDYYCEANSDGDVVLHSLCSALSSAIGGDSLGTWADEMCLKKGITDSKEYLKVIVKRFKGLRFKVENVSVAIEAAVPKIPLAKFQEMKKAMAGLLGIDKGRVGITITSGEGLTEFGRGKGIQVITVVSLKIVNS